MRSIHCDRVLRFGASQMIAEPRNNAAASEKSCAVETAVPWLSTSWLTNSRDCSVVKPRD